MTTDDPRELCERAAALRNEGQLEQALALFKQAYLRNTEDFSVRERIADVLGELGDVPRAVRSYRLVAAQYAAIGRLFDAIAICQKILALDPDHGETQVALARLYSMTREHENVVTVVSAEEEQQDARDLGLSVTQRLSQDSREIKITSLPQIPIFSGLPREAFVSVVNHMRTRRTQPGERVIREGDKDRSMFIVVSGSFAISRSDDPDRDGDVVDTLGAGAFFGEMSLIANTARFASVDSNEEGLLLELRRESYLEVIELFPTFGVVVERHFRERLVANLMRSSPVFRAFSAGAKMTLIDNSAIEIAEAGATLLEIGRPGAAVYLLLRGECDVHHKGPDGSAARLPAMSEGDLFGEISVVFESPCTATVRARTESTLLRIDPDTFRGLVAAHPEVKNVINQLASHRLRRTARLLKHFA